jgi:hypothetical protein
MPISPAYARLVGSTVGSSGHGTTARDRRVTPFWRREPWPSGSLTLHPGDGPGEAEAQGQESCARAASRSSWPVMAGVIENEQRSRPGLNGGTSAIAWIHGRGLPVALVAWGRQRS